LLAKGNPNEPRDRESTPQAPGDSSGAQRKPADPAKPAGKGTPESPGPDPEEEASNAPGGPPPGAKTSLVRSSDANDRWGDLPIQVREVFRTEGGADLPPEYRDWIDGYYQKLLRQR